MSREPLLTCRPAGSLCVYDLGPFSIAPEGEAAARMLKNRIVEFARAQGRGPVPVRLGLGAGRRTMQIAMCLGRLLRSALEVPNVSKPVLYAMSSGFLSKQPESAPVGFSSFFMDAVVPVELVGLFTEALVRTREFEPLKNQAGVEVSLERGKEVQIVVTSFASASDEHGLLNQLERQYGVNGAQPRVGDVQFRTYGAKGPIEDPEDGVRAVTLFELEDSVRMTRDEGKLLLLVAGPQGDGETRTGALLPLLQEPSLRVRSHLRLDRRTALEAVRALEPSGPVVVARST